LAILPRTFTDPTRLTPAMLARADASVADLGQLWHKLAVWASAPFGLVSCGL
jgi:hypothetical protein